MVHYLWVGPFETEDGHVRFVRVTDPAPHYQWVIARPIDESIVAEAVREQTGSCGPAFPLPAAWKLYLSPDGVLTLDRYTKQRDAVEVVARVVERTGAQIWDDKGVTPLTRDEMLANWLAQRDRIERHRDRQGRGQA